MSKVPFGISQFFRIKSKEGAQAAQKDGEVGDSFRLETTSESDLRKIRRFFYLVTIVMAASVSSWSLHPLNLRVFLASMGLVLLMVGGAALIGGLVGLLFGIPKSISDPATVLNPAPTSRVDRSGSEADVTSQNLQNANSLVVSNSALPIRARYAANSNLEQVSDWLTKIIVGVGLVQINDLMKLFARSTDFFASGFPSELGGEHTKAFVASLLVYGGMSGFLGGYLLTRMYLPGAFDRAEEAEERTRQMQEVLRKEHRSRDELRRLEGEIIEHIDLYEQRGFEKVIDTARSLLSAEGQRSNPKPWFYLACAYGQAYRWEEEHPGPNKQEHDDKLKLFRAEALQAVRNTLYYGPSWKRAIQIVWNPKFPGKPKDEDDLQVFYTEDSTDAFWNLLR